MGKIMLNGKQYGVGGITDAEDVKYGNTTVDAALDQNASDISTNTTEINTLKAGSILPRDYESLSIPSGWNGYVRLFRYGKMRSLIGSVKSSSTGVGLLVSTLSETDRPPINIVASCSAYGVSIQSEVEVNSDGQIKLNIPANGNSNFLKFTVAFTILS